MAGVVTIVWVDRAEAIIRYLEVEVAGGRRRVLLPMGLAARRLGGRSASKSIPSLGNQFADVPGHRNPDQVTLLEEDKIYGYYGGRQTLRDAVTARSR